jgi:hypothetical protein
VYYLAVVLMLSGMPSTVLMTTMEPMDLGRCQKSITNFDTEFKHPPEVVARCIKVVEHNDMPTVE